MRILLDTHFAYWLTVDRAKLRQREFDAVRNPGNEVWVSTVSIWELRLKWHTLHKSGVPKGPIDPANALAAMRLLGLQILTLTPDVVATRLHTPIVHSDPFDELLLTVAQEGQMALLTRDGDCLKHPLAFSPT